ncbi:MAG TPA: hypothetical protein H9862_01365, partial [Candidatus Akkermansia intestinigallinarum]|nr:hypothetical protein [Candidatus Akkermansia intestinigallinarum]
MSGGTDNGGAKSGDQGLAVGSAPRSTGLRARALGEEPAAAPGRRARQTQPLEPSPCARADG